jgi:hypothetical protein
VTTHLVVPDVEAVDALPYIDGDNGLAAIR